MNGARLCWACLMAASRCLESQHCCKAVDIWKDASMIQTKNYNPANTLYILILGSWQRCQLQAHLFE